MMITSVLSRLALVVILVYLSACSVIKSYFPDKEKDYQFAVEISPLVIPADLSHPMVKPIETIETSTSSESSAQRPTPPKQPSTWVELVTFSGGASRIRLGDSIERSWRMVGKALSRNSIEIIDRNVVDKVYKVQYDPRFKKQHDDSIWDELVFIFGDDPAQEQTLQVKLVENGGLTEIMVLNKQGKALSRGYGLQLLTQLQQSLQQDLK